ncbi:MAG: DUF4097 family beta strand repeat protein [Tenericutes bacterium]|nr:DUF4097 family beta strand repeat protein [Mycoplasmatota bacterium]
MKKYLKDLEEELRKNNLNEKEIEEILADHEEMIEAAINDGLSDEELNTKFGDPKTVAEELSGFSESESDDDKEHKKQDGKMMVFDNIDENYNVNIALINEDISVQSNDSNNITVEFFGITNIDKYQIEYKKNTFILKSPKEIRKSYFGFSKNRRFVVTLPKNLQINDFEMKLINADAKIDDILSAKTLVDTKNGDLKLKNIKTGEFRFNSINGDSTLETINCDKIKISTISGDLQIENLKAKGEMFVNSVSGDLRIKDSECLNVTLKTVSGDIKATEFYPKTVTLSSVSGDIKIVNTDSSRPIEVTHKRSLSGDVDIILKKKKE